MDRYTAAAMGQNISRIGEAFMQMNDPRARAQAQMLRLQMEGQTEQNKGESIRNAFLPGISQSQIDQNKAAASAHTAQAGLYGSQKQNWDIRNQAGQQLMTPPLTAYSTGAAVGGSDEMQDLWTNKGFTSTGENLSPGVVAVGSRQQIGDVYRDQNGQTYIAADRHGNADKSVVDIFQPGDSYNPSAVQGLQLTRVGKEQIPYGTTADQLAAMRQKYENQNVLSNIFGGGGAADLATGQAKSAALTAPDELSMRRALGAQGQVMGQGEYFDPASSDRFQANDIAGAFARAQLQEEGMNLRKSADIIAGGGFGRSATGTTAGSGYGKNPLDAVNGAELTAKMSAERFGLVNEAGVPIIDPGMRPAAIAWEASVANLTEQGIPIQTAISIADQHHNIAGISRAGDGWFDGDPRMQTGAEFNPASIVPEEARRFGISYAMQPEFGGGGERMFAAGMLNPQIAQLAEQMQPTAVQQEAPAMIPPMLQRPADPVPSTGEARASDEFKPRESSVDQNSRKEKEAKISTLKAKIAERVKTLRDGGFQPQSGFASQGGMGSSLPQSNAFIRYNNDGYNAALGDLKKLEAELSALTGQPAQTVQPASLEDRLSKYR